MKKRALTHTIALIFVSMSLLSCRVDQDGSEFTRMDDSSDLEEISESQTDFQEDESEVVEESQESSVEAEQLEENIEYENTDTEDSDSEGSVAAEEAKVEQIVPTSEITECLSPTNLVRNGSFEQGHGLRNNSWDVFRAIDFWESNLEYNDAGMEIQTGTTGGIRASDGNAKLELDSHRKHGFTATNVEIFQDIGVIPRKKYILTFDFSPRIQGDNETNKAEVLWDNQIIGKLNATRVGWNNYALKIETTRETGRLSLRSGSLDDDTVGALMDNIRLREIEDCRE